MRRLAILLLPLALAGCASSDAVQEAFDARDGNAPFQLVDAGMLPRGAVIPSLGPNPTMDFAVIFSNVSHGEQHVDRIVIAQLDDTASAYTFNPVTRRVDRMIEEDEDFETEFLIHLVYKSTEPRDPPRSSGLQMRVTLYLRDGTGWAYPFEIPRRNLPRT